MTKKTGKQSINIMGERLIILLMGSQGVGKGTYGALLSKEYNIPLISTGDLFREAAANKTGLGIKARDEYWGQGKLVPDNLTLKLLQERISQNDCKNGFLLDGFPRTLNQAEELDKIAKVDLVLHFVASEKVILERLGNRIICRKCQKIYHRINMPTKVPGVCDVCGGEIYQREDDTPELIKIRLKEYWTKTKPVFDYYKNKNLLSEIDASFPIEEVDKILKQVEKEIEKIKK